MGIEGGESIEIVRSTGLGQAAIRLVVALTLVGNQIVG